MLSAFIENLNAGSTRVYSPKPYFLVCGGPIGSIIDPKPISLRDAFLRSDFVNAIRQADILQIEEIIEYFEKDSPYSNLVSFERDIAQMSELVILFSEGPGSFTELGTFSAYSEIFEKIIVIIQSKYLTKSSYILKGPITSLRERNDNSVFSITNGQVGIKVSDFSSVDPKVLLALLAGPIKQRLVEARSKTTLQPNKFGHKCKLYIGFLREFSVLKDAELKVLFKAFKIAMPTTLLNRIAFCCKCVNWSRTSQAGFDRVHFALEGNEAAMFDLKGDLSDKLRRRIELREHWVKIDPARIDARTESMAS